MQCFEWKIGVYCIINVVNLLFLKSKITRFCRVNNICALYNLRGYVEFEM